MSWQSTKRSISIASASSDPFLAQGRDALTAFSRESLNQLCLNPTYGSVMLVTCFSPHVGRFDRCDIYPATGDRTDRSRMYWV